MILRPRKGHVYLLPDGEDHSFRNSLIIRHADYTPVSQTAKVVAIGKPVEKVKRGFRRWVRVRERPDVEVGERVYFPGKHLGHEIQIDNQTLRVLDFEQIKDCVVIEGDTDVR